MTVILTLSYINLAENFYNFCKLDALRYTSTLSKFSHRMYLDYGDILIWAAIIKFEKRRWLSYLPLILVLNKFSSSGTAVFVIRIWHFLVGEGTVQFVRLRGRSPNMKHVTRASAHAASWPTRIWQHAPFVILTSLW